MVLEALNVPIPQGVNLQVFSFYKLKCGQYGGVWGEYERNILTHPGPSRLMVVYTSEMEYMSCGVTQRDTGSHREGFQARLVW